MSARDPYPTQTEEPQEEYQRLHLLLMRMDRRSKEAQLIAVRIKRLHEQMWGDERALPVGEAK